jgi:hypothetical protein
MKPAKLRNIISDLEISVRNLQLISNNIDLDYDNQKLVDEAYSLLKESIKHLSEEEVVMEIENISDNEQ